MKTCNCIAKLDKNLKSTAGSTAFLVLKQSINIRTGKTAMELPPLEFRFNKKLSNGKLSPKETRGFIPFKFCPLCGILK